MTLSDADKARLVRGVMGGYVTGTKVFTYAVNGRELVGDICVTIPDLAAAVAEFNRRCVTEPHIKPVEGA